MKVTIDLPDPIFQIVKERAQDFKTTPEEYIVRNLVLIFGPCIFDRSKWLKPGQDNSLTYKV